MLTIHWLELLFGGVIISVCFYILGALEGIPLDPEANFAPKEVFYTPEEDAYWAEWVKINHQGRK